MFEWMYGMDLGTKAFVAGIVILILWSIFRSKDNNKSRSNSGPKDITGQNKPPGSA